MISDRISRSLQENILTILAHNDQVGGVVANMVDPQLFEGDYRIFAERVIEYWGQHKQAPKYHTSDLVAEIIEDPKNRKAASFKTILNMMLELAEHVNTSYVVGQLRAFTRLQRMKDAVLKSAERLNDKQELAIDEVEEILNDLLRSREIDFAPGMRLTDVDRLLSYMEQQYVEFSTGVTVLDTRYIVPYRAAFMLFLGAAGQGKSWFLVGTGKQALLRRQRVVHLSLEMSEEEVMQRYYQALFSASKRDEVVKVSRLNFDELNRVESISDEQIEAEFTFAVPHIRDELNSHLRFLRGAVNNLRVKRFSPRTLTLNGIEAYLDNLEATENFVPDLLVIDSPYLMKTDVRDYRIQLGRNLEGVRGICVDRNIAGVGGHQLSKEGADALIAKSTNVAEDWSQIQTADVVVVMSKTDMEAMYGLARLYVSKARTEVDKFGVLITQNYTIGQFCLESAILESKYFDHLKTLESTTPEFTQAPKTDAKRASGDDLGDD